MLSASDDAIVKMVDVESEKLIHGFEGHKLGVTSITSFLGDSKIFFSTSFDKIIKMWDSREKSCVGTTLTPSPLWDCRSLGETLVAGGDSGVMFVYSMK